MVFVAFFVIFAKNMAMDRSIRQCISDIKEICASGRYTLEAQVRAYDLLSCLVEMKDAGTLPSSLESASEYVEAYESSSAALRSAFDYDRLQKDLSEVMKPLETACVEARYKAAAAASLHEFAKETFEIWQTAGIFARRRALRELRERAGFRLESHRIGNYVAKTFDLMNEAYAAFARSQQTLFAANVSYKIQEGTYGKIASILKDPVE